MKRVLFISCLYSDTQKDSFLRNSKRGYQFAAQNFQEAIVEGLLENEASFSVLSVPPLSTFPAGCKIPFVKGTPFIYNSKPLGECLGFLNIPFFNRPSKSHAINYVKNWITENSKEEKVLIVYSLNRYLMSIAVQIKKQYNDIKIVIIVPDLPEYMAWNKYYKVLGLQNRDIESIYNMVNYFDGLVVLAEPMINKLNANDKPHVIIEGIYKDELLETVPKEKKKVILYTGGLNIRYGILDLLDSFRQIKSDNYQLWLCGGGSAENIILEYMQKDNRIIYYGRVSKEKAREYQQKATILINPRHGNEEYTKYSFPSKTMEYLASGTPTLMCHLGCIPSEYDEHIFYFEDESIDGMTNKIVELCEKSNEELTRKGIAARNFILKEKTSNKQVSKILDLINNL